MALIDDYLAISRKEARHVIVPDERLHERDIYQPLWFLFPTADHAYPVAFEREELRQSLLPLPEQLSAMDKDKRTDLPLRYDCRCDDGFAEARGRFEHSDILLQDRIQRHALLVS